MYLCLVSKVYNLEENVDLDGVWNIKNKTMGLKDFNQLVDVVSIHRQFVS